MIIFNFVFYTFQEKHYGKLCILRVNGVIMCSEEGSKWVNKLNAEQEALMREVFEDKFTLKWEKDEKL